MSDVGESPRRRDSELLDVALDEAQVLDDYLRGVVALADGRIGGTTEAERGWRRVFGWTRTGGQQQVVKAMAGQYGGDQLNKAARQCPYLCAAITALESASGEPARRAAQVARERGVDTFGERLNDRSLSVRSPELRTLYGDLGRVIAALGEARTKTILLEMRQQ